MKKQLFASIVLSLFFLGAMSQEYKFGTFNIRYASPGDIGNLWVDRMPAVAALIDFHEFDVFGTQEGLKHQLDDLQRTLPQYVYYGKGRNSGDEKGEHSAIFYRKDKFKLLSQGDFWLSETPDKPGKGWDATCCNRICSWIYLQDKISKKKFYFFNAHFDHQGLQARNESSKLMLLKIKEIAKNEPVVFVGDLNGNHQSSWYLTLKNSGWLKDTFTQVKNPYINNSSFNGFGLQKASDKKEVIDHIFLTEHFQVKKWGILTDTYQGKFPSDHFPVISVVELK